MRKWYLLISLIISFSVEAKNNASFVDRCSLKETNVSTPNGVKLLVNLAGLSPEFSVNLEVIIRPALPPDSIRRKDYIIWNYRLSTGNDGTLSEDIFLPKTKWMRNVESRYKNFRIWDAEITWNQPEAKISGSQTASFYHAPETGPYFQVLSRSICHRQEKAEVSSKLFENLGTHPMTVTQQMDFIWEQGSTRGMTLGYNNFQGNAHPLAQFSASSLFLGWLFRDWQIQSDTNQTAGLESKFTLNPNESGVFISRMSYNRHKVRRFDWNPEAGECGEYVPVSNGHLDVGHKTKGNFVVIPAEFISRPEKLREFLDQAAPAINNCSTGARPDDVLTSAPDGVLLYYKN